MAKNFLDKSKVKVEELARQTNTYLVDKYRQTRDVFSPSAAYGQILKVLQEYVSLIMFYIEDSVIESSI